MAGGDPRSTAEILWLGVRGRCPRCGRGSLFAGYLEVAPGCSACGLGFAGHDAGDGPAVFVMFILGFAVVGLALVTELTFAPPLWLHGLLWTPLIIGGAVAFLRPSKGLTIAAQYRFRAVDEPQRPGGT
jgi:uncharacterized protein (DUF983 family)